MLFFYNLVFASNFKDIQQDLSKKTQNEIYTLRSNLGEKIVSIQKKLNVLEKEKKFESFFLILKHSIETSVQILQKDDSLQDLKSFIARIDVVVTRLYLSNLIPLESKTHLQCNELIKEIVEMRSTIANKYLYNLK